MINFKKILNETINSLSVDGESLILDELSKNSNNLQNKDKIIVKSNPKTKEYLIAFVYPNIFIDNSKHELIRDGFNVEQFPMKFIQKEHSFIAIFRIFEEYLEEDKDFIKTIDYKKLEKILLGVKND